MLTIGDPAPNITLETQTGETLSLQQFRGQQAVVLFFYPRNGTAVCTAEACAFRDAFDDFVTAGAVVIGVSENTLESHRKFGSQHGLPFHLASDQGGAIAKAFGVKKTLGLIPGRVTFVIDKQGIIRHTFSALLVADRHVREALAVVKELAESK